MTLTLPGRFLFFLAVVTIFFNAQRGYSQCATLPTVIASGASQNFPQLCAPVGGGINYNVEFINPINTGPLDIVIDWGDGTSKILPQTLGGKIYTVTNEPKAYPINSDCEYLVKISIRYKGELCTKGQQIQKIRTWRTDEYNGGNVQLISPVTGTNEHLVCQGEDVDVFFQDQTNFNCNENYVHTPPDAILNPNDENRWQQIIYNTPIGGSKIPNVTVHGATNVLLTNGAGADVVADKLDPRVDAVSANGVFYMPTPVTLLTPKRNALQLTAPGGFGAGFPQVGDVFEVTIKYWNFCNPYSTSGNPLVPTNGDVINGDNAPVIRTATIRIVDAPPAPTATDEVTCNGTTPSPFQVNGVPAGNLVTFYRNTAGAPGAVIGTPSTNTSLAVTAHPDWAGSDNTAKIYQVWASYRPNVVGSCESPKILITRTIRESSLVPNPTLAPPAEICNLNNASAANSFSITLPGPATETIGGATEYRWNSTLPSGITLTTNTANSATYGVNVTFAPTDVYLDKTLTISRRYTTSPSCNRNKSFTIRVYNTALGGTPSVVPDVCETTPVGTITLNGYRGEIVKWEVRKDAGAFVDYTGTASGNTITPGLLIDGTYRFRAQVRSGSIFSTGPCGPVYSTERQVIVYNNPAPAVITPNSLAYCMSLTSDPLGGSNPLPGTGAWSYVSSSPAGLPAPSFDLGVSNPATTVTIAAGNEGAYTLRWTVTNGICSSSADVLVDFGGTPSPPDAGLPKSVCGSTTSVAAVAPTSGVGKWTVSAVPPGGTISFIDDDSPTTGVTLGASPVYGAYTLTWTVSNACLSNPDDVIITFYEPTSVSATDIASTCIGPTPAFAPFILNGTVGGGVTDGTWENISGNNTIGGTSAMGGGSYQGSYTPNLADYNDGDPIRVKLIANPLAGSPCTASEKEIVINIDRRPAVNPGANIPNICGTQATLNAENPPPYGATGLWTTATAGVIIANPTQTNSSVSSLPLGPTTLTWTLTSASGNCTNSADVILTRVAPPALTPYVAIECEVVPAGPPVTSNILLTNYETNIGTLPPSRTIAWFKDAPPPFGTAINSALPQNNILSGQLYFARVTDLSSNCSSNVQLTINVKPLPSAVDAIIGVCEADPVNFPGVSDNIDLSTSYYIDQVTGGDVSVNVRWYPTVADAQTANAAAQIVAPFTFSGSRVVYARVQYNTGIACPDIAEVELTVNTIPNITSIDGDPTVCMGQSGQDPNELQIETYQVASIPGAKYVWEIPAEFLLFGGGAEGDFFVLLKFPFENAPPNRDIKVTISYNNCASKEISLPIVRSTLPAPPVINGDPLVCEKNLNVQYDIVSPNTNSDYNWEILRASNNSLGGGSIGSGQTTSTIQVDFLSEDVIVRVIEANKGNADCASLPTEYPVKISMLPKMENPLVTQCSNVATGIEFTPSLGSVTIDHFSITNINTDPDLTINMTAPSFAPASGDVAFDYLTDVQYINKKKIALPVNDTVAPVSVETIVLPFNFMATCVGEEKTVALIVNPEPFLDFGLGKDVCSDLETELTLRASVNSYPADQFIITDIIHEDLANPLTGVSPVADPLVALGADAIYDAKWTNPGAPTHSANAPYIVRYMISPKSSATGCIGTPALPVEIAVFPVPDITITSATVCSGSSIDIGLEAANVTNAGTEWRWVVNGVTSNLKGAQPGGASGANVATIPDIITNETFTLGTVSYQIIAETTLSSKLCSILLLLLLM